MDRKALIVEDEPRTQQLLAEILASDGLEVDLAGDGEVAIEMLSRHAYAVILLDIVLPRVSGTAVMEYLRATNPAVLSRVIVVTGLDITEIRGLFPTVLETLSKPVIPARLRSSVRSCLAGPSAAS